MRKKMKTNTHNNQSPSKRSLTSMRLYPWLIVLMSSLFLFYKYILQVSPSVMTNELMSHFHMDGAQLGNLAATFFYTYLVVQLFVGALLDKYNPRLLSSLALAVSALGAIVFARSHSLHAAELGRALMGVGAAFATVNYLKMAALWFKPEKFAFVGGLLATAAMVGSMAGQVPLAFLVSHTGWQNSLYFCGLLGLAFAFLYYCFVRNPTPALLAQQNLPKTKSPSLKDFVHLLKQKHNWMLMLYSGLAFSPLAVLGGLWGNPFLQETFHINKTHAASITSLMFFGLALGGPLFGLLSDKLGERFNTMLAGLLLSLVSLVFALYFPELPLWLEGTFLFLFGLGTGAFMLGFTVGKEMNVLGLAASVVALVNTGDALFGAVSEPMVGKLLDLFWAGDVVNGAHHFTTHEFHLSFLILPTYLLLAVVFLLLAKKKYRVYQN